MDFIILIIFRQFFYYILNLKVFLLKQLDFLNILILPIFILKCYLAFLPIQMFIKIPLN